MPVKPIDTEYNGYLFRSRLEARWAVFLDTIGFSYDYEAEGYDLGGSGWYLPDFWVPPQSGFEGGFIEIKRHTPEESERQKAEALARGLGWSVYVFYGQFDVNPDPMGDGWGVEPQAEWFSAGEGWDAPYLWCQCHICGAVGIEFDGRGARIRCGCSHAEHGNGDKCYAYDTPLILDALRRAKKARFEHGASGG